MKKIHKMTESEIRRWAGGTPLRLSKSWSQLSAQLGPDGRRASWAESVMGDTERSIKKAWVHRLVLEVNLVLVVVLVGLIFSAASGLVQFPELQIGGKNPTTGASTAAAAMTTKVNSSGNDKQNFEVYLFQGEDTHIRISDGLIMISPDKHIANGGNIVYIGDRQEGIQAYTETVYFEKNNKKEVILTNAVSVAGSTEGMVFPDQFQLNKGVGEISSVKIFNEADIDIMKENLYFSLDYVTFSGKSSNFTIKLNVKEFK